jgi:hypothetical protein
MRRMIESERHLDRRFKQRANRFEVDVGASEKPREPPSFQVPRSPT